MIICCDLDGTLCEHRSDGQYHLATPYTARIDWIRNLYHRGHTIIIDTARGSQTGIDWRPATEAQLGDWGVPFHELRVGDKPYADLYVDDKGVNAVEYFGAVIGRGVDGRVQ